MEAIFLNFFATHSGGVGGIKWALKALLFYPSFAFRDSSSVALLVWIRIVIISKFVVLIPEETEAGTDYFVVIKNFLLGRNLL